MRCCVIRCMEEMGDWGKVLEVIDLETSESAADGESASEEVVTEPDDSRLFLTTDTWNGPKYLRCMLTRSMQAIMKDLLDCTPHGLFSNGHLSSALGTDMCNNMLQEGHNHIVQVAECRCHTLYGWMCAGRLCGAACSRAASGAGCMNFCAARRPMPTACACCSSTLAWSSRWKQRTPWNGTGVP